MGTTNTGGSRVETFYIDGASRFDACDQARTVPGVVLVRKCEPVGESDLGAAVWAVTVDVVTVAS